ncbi:alpha/beta fold hydrolase [Deinococcus sp. Arct2-2]|uniref:alpha/beta fold hydrolase n=1 Tax=Deinococcus sp. Arct2-2 TaxID=2568653 RepID=UPI0010A3D56F|nr:alpha/beta fold hydrolase [Deinococcus sp. Arct2-2]THF70822.1 alpha/beta fold hydrolase [Deinococcus sp. Arct2-2]
MSLPALPVPVPPLPALLLPGTLCDAALWAAVRLPAGTQVQDTVRGRTLAQAAAQVLQDAPAAVHLVGFSLGAIVAFEVLRRAPERVARLTLISANPHAPTAGQLDAWATQERQVQAGQFADAVDSLSGGPHRQAVLDMARRVGPEIFLEQLALLRARPNSCPTLADWAGPLTVLVGENDLITPPYLAEEIKQLAPQTVIQLVPDAGHYLPLDAPHAVSDILREVAYA